MKVLRNIIFAISAMFAVMSCSQKKPQYYTISCDANGNPVFVTAK